MKKEKFDFEEKLFGKKDKVLIIEEEKRKFVVKDEVLFFYYDKEI